MSKNTGPRGLTTTLAAASLGFHVVASATGASAQAVDNLGPFAAASVGSTIPTTPAEGYKTAAEGGPSFGTPGGPTDRTVFALTQTAATITTTGDKRVVAADATTDADGATVTEINRNIDEFELQIPGLTIDAKLKLVNDPSTGGLVASTRLPSGDYLGVQTFDDNLNYAVLGKWGVAPTKGGQDTNAAYFMLGYQTAPSAMPKKGEAIYSGVDNVNGTVLIQGGGTGQLTGNGLLVANFAKDTVSGLLSDITVTSDTGATSPWDTVSLSGTISGDLISGTASVAASPGGSLSLAKSGKGTISGGFYGPTANEVALIWTLRDGKGSNAVGSFGAANGLSCLTCVTPSDRRLKHEIAPAGRLANGLALYTYAYLGDERRFTGVMAQDLVADPRFASAVITDEDGLMRVDYAQLGLIPPDSAAMAAAGERAVSLYRGGGV